MWIISGLRWYFVVGEEFCSCMVWCRDCWLSVRFMDGPVGVPTGAKGADGCTDGVIVCKL